MQDAYVLIDVETSRVSVSAKLDTSGLMTTKCVQFCCSAGLPRSMVEVGSEFGSHHVTVIQYCNLSVP
jgi:hypothetical protein